MSSEEKKHPEAYEDFKIGDRVFCLAWTGMPFEVTAKDESTRRISLNGLGPCSLSEGAKIDIDPSAMFMLSHNLWDTIWHWRDRAGETYKQVVRRFIDQHKDGEIVAGYAIAPVTVECPHYVTPDPKKGMTFRLNYGALIPLHQIHVEPLAAIDYEKKQLMVHYDPSIPEDRWVRNGPPMALRLELHAYRWALVYGRILLNWTDFAE